MNERDAATMISAVPITRTCPHRGGAAVDRLRKPIPHRNAYLAGVPFIAHYATGFNRTVVSEDGG